MVARRLQHFQASAETCLSFKPVSFKQVAGLIAHYDRMHCHYLRVTSAGEEELKVGVISSADTKASSLEAVELPLAAGERIYLRMSMNYANLRFAGSRDGNQWQWVG